MIINVSFDGRKLFNWEGGTAEATKIEEDVGEVAALANMTPETLWQSTLAKIAANGGWVFSGNPEPEMMIVIAGCWRSQPITRIILAIAETTSKYRISISTSRMIPKIQHSTSM